MSIRQAICDEIADQSEWDRPQPSDLRTVEFRRGMAEIDVTYAQEYDDGTDIEHVTVPTESVLSILLQKLVDDEHTQEKIEKGLAE